MSEKSIAKSAGVIGLSTLASRILGLFRDIVSATMFGTSLIWDSFLIAFMIPNLLRRLLGEGALSSSFIPVFTRYLEKEPRRQAWHLVSLVFTLLFVVLIAIILVGILGINSILNNFSPSYKIALILRLTRVMLPYIFFLSLAALAMGILNSFKHFTAPALSPILLNLCWLGALFYLCPRFGESLENRIWGLTIGILIGGLCQLAVQIPVLIKKGLRFVNLRFSFDLTHPGVRRIGYLMVPAVLGLGITQINILVDLLLGYLLGDGAISALWYGNRLMQFPLAIFGIALGTAVLPTMASQVAREDMIKLKETFSFALRMVFFIIVPAAVGLIILRFPIIRLLFERGHFTNISTNRTAMTLLFYSLGLFSYAGVKIIVPCFYSLQDTRTPVKVGALAMVANIILNLILMWPLREGGLALATALSSMINLSLLFLILRKKIGHLGGKRILVSFVRISLSAAVMGLACWLMLNNLAFGQDASGVTKLVNMLIPILGGVVVFMVASSIFGVEEMGTIRRWILKRD